MGPRAVDGARGEGPPDVVGELNGLGNGATAPKPGGYDVVLTQGFSV